MPEMPIAEAMDEAQAEMAIEDALYGTEPIADETVTHVDTETGEETPAPTEPAATAAPADPSPPTEAKAATQRELFPPPPFDYEEAFDVIAVARQRVSVARTAMEDAKDRATAARKRYDSAVRDLTVEIEGFEDRQHRHAQEVAAVERLQAAERAVTDETLAADDANPTTEGGDSNVSDVNETQDLEQEPEPTQTAPKDPPTETTSAAPGD